MVWARAFPSAGVDDRAPCFGVPDLGIVLLGPDGEVGGGVEITIGAMPARRAAEDPGRQRQRRDFSLDPWIGLVCRGFDSGAEMAKVSFRLG
jgi:hypothetical protein